MAEFESGPSVLADAARRTCELEARVAELESENAALREALADNGGPGFWFRGWERAREHFSKGNNAND